MQFLCGVLVPAMLIGAGILLGFRLRFFWIFHPRRTWCTLREAAAAGGTSPGAALSMALAGTLGVGNIVGVAAAITAGGAGAVFWMIFGALAAMSVKYAEVYLAVRFRRTRAAADGCEYFGGAMYYIRDGLSARARGVIGRRAAALCGGFFALLCVFNALLTGNAVQVHAAAACTPLPPLYFGLLFAAAVWLASGFGMRRAAAAASVVIPVLAALFVLLSGIILFSHMEDIPPLLSRIWHEAWDFRPAAGGAIGFSVSHAVRHGITRGILSNEAGCGTAPAAHATASVKSPHHQGCFGIFEVFADTVLLCSMTALVILLYADSEGLDGIALSLSAYTRLAAQIGGVRLGAAAEIMLRGSIVLFAFAAAVSQSCYALEAVRFLSQSSRAQFVCRLAFAGASVLGAVIPATLMWNLADAVIGVMTVVNTACLLILRREVE